MRELIMERLRAPVASGLTGDHYNDSDLWQADQGRHTPAAVLVPIIEHQWEMTVLFTQRTAHLNDHAGQVSFPGGRVEAYDADAVETALRETEEEIGLSRSYVEVVGTLDDYITGTGFRVTPVVGFVRPGFMLKPDPFEVAHVFEVPLRFLLDPANHQLHEAHFKGRLRKYYAMPYNGHNIWGATAGMVVNFAQRLKG
jgi:8-oxo-dGTP pyrophosphatase MutT (NUDIX family)